jgi:hypothetical protein
MRALHPDASMSIAEEANVSRVVRPGESRQEESDARTVFPLLTHVSCQDKRVLLCEDH